MVVHDDVFIDGQFSARKQESYFRLYHPLHSICSTKLDGYQILTASPSNIADFVRIINQSYKDISVTYEQLIDYTQTEVFMPDLWILIRNDATGEFVGGGIADLDREAREGILEWIQVLPNYRRQKIGQLIVNELLHRMQGLADFATVSGKTSNATNPEKLYRRCGFLGNNIWHVLEK